MHGQRDKYHHKQEAYLWRKGIHPMMAMAAGSAGAGGASRKPGGNGQSGNDAGVGARILVVEDNPLNQKVAVAMLERLGYGTEIASSGKDALRFVDEGKYDLIFMDCQMPEMDGFETTRELRALEGDSAHTPIVAMTAHATTEDRNRCLEAGMDDYIAKPIRLEALRKILERWLVN